MGIPIISALGVTFVMTLLKLITDCQDLQIIRNSAVVLNNMFTHGKHIRQQALQFKSQENIFPRLCAAFLKWSGAEDYSQVTPSTLVCQELSRALMGLAKEKEIIRQNVLNDGISLVSLQKIADAKIQGVSDQAQQVVSI